LRYHSRDNSYYELSLGLQFLQQVSSCSSEKMDLVTEF